MSGSAAIERLLMACVQQCEGPWALPEAAGSDGVWSQILGGPLTAALLGDHSVPMPAALPAALAMRSVEPVQGPPPGLSPESARTNWLVGLYCAAEGALRDAQARAMAEAAAGWAAAENWAKLCRAPIETRHGSLDADAAFQAGPDAREIQARNIFSAEMSGRGLAVWAVTWEILLCAPLRGVAPSEPRPVPRTLYAGWAFETGPDRRGDYRRLSP